jgi:tetratricopeptide (TPR) repeat protein
LLQLRGDHAGADEALKEAVAASRSEIQIKPELHGPHDHLGLALGLQGKIDEALLEFREAIRLAPDCAVDHYNLGNALSVQGKPAEAMLEFRETIRLKPNFAEAYCNLGKCLRQRGEYFESLAMYSKGHELGSRQAGWPYPSATWLAEAERLAAEAHNNLGNALQGQRKLTEAIAEFRAAIRLKPDFAEAHYHVGDALGKQGKLSEAIVAFREAVRLKPDLAEAHYGLGLALHFQGKLPEAIAAFRDAIRVKPDNAEAHCNLGHELSQQGQFREALSELRRGHELGSRQVGWPYPSAQWVRRAERMVALRTRLPAVLRGDDKPKDAAEGIAFGELAYKAKHFGLSARLSSESLQADPKLAEDMKAENRYNAACAAALAGAGQGDTKPPLDEKEKTRWRKQALDWLRADLGFWGRQAETGKPEAKALVTQQLQHWKIDTDLTGIREERAIRALPDEEQKACRALWAEVDALLAKARADSAPGHRQ